MERIPVKESEDEQDMINWKRYIKKYLDFDFARNAVRKIKKARYYLKSLFPENKYPVFEDMSIVDNFRPAHILEFFTTASGRDSSVDIAASPYGFKAAASMKISYDVKTDDYEKNWFRVSRKPYSQPADFSEYDGLLVFLRGSGPGEFRFTMEDLSTGEWVWNSMWPLGQKLFVPVYMPFHKFFKPSWAKGSGKPRRFNRVIGYSFTVGPAWLDAPYGGTLEISGMYLVKAFDYKRPKAEKELSVRNLKIFEDYSGDFRERITLDAGPDSKASISRDTVNTHLERPSLCLDYSIPTENHKKNWISLKFTNPAIAANIRNGSGIGIWVKSSGQGGELRWCLTAEDTKYTLSDFTALSKNSWEFVFYPFSRFTTEFFRKPRFAFDTKKLGPDTAGELELFIGPGFGGRIEEGKLFISAAFFVNSYDLWTRDRMSAGRGTNLVLCSEGKLCDIDPMNIPLKYDSTELKWFLTQEKGSGLLEFFYQFSPKCKARWFAMVLAENLLVDFSSVQGFMLRFRSRDPGPSVCLKFTVRQEMLELKGSSLLPDRDGYIMFFPMVVPAEGFSYAGNSVPSRVELIFGHGLDDIAYENTVVIKSLDYAGVGTGTQDSGFTPLGVISEKILGISVSEPKKSVVRTGVGFRLGDKIMDFESVGKESGMLSSLESPAARKIDPFVIMNYGKKSSRDHFPLSKAAVFVELTNLCNLRCIMCNHGDGSFKRPLGVMKFKDYKKILYEIRKEKYDIWEFAPFWLGEPFIHPQVNDFLQLTGEVRSEGRAIQNFNIHTNGACLNDSHLESMISSGLDVVLFSIDAASAATYEKIRRGGNFDKVISNVAGLMEKREKRGSVKPHIVVQAICMDENSHEIVAFSEFWKSRGIIKTIYAGPDSDNPFPDVRTRENLLFPEVREDLAFIKGLEPNALTKSQRHREVDPLKFVSKPEKRWACASLFRMMSVSYSGEATSCCRDDQLEMKIGNVFETSLAEVWNGPKLMKQRLDHIRGELSAYPKCLSCNNWVKEKVPPAEISGWLVSINEEKLAEDYLGRFAGA